MLGNRRLLRKVVKGARHAAFIPAFGAMLLIGGMSDAASLPSSVPSGLIRYAAPSRTSCKAPIRSSSPRLLERDGDLWFQTSAKVTLQRLTSDGKSFAPAWSPDGSRIAFIRKTKGVIVSTGAGDIEANELWIMNADGSHSRRLFRGRTGEPYAEKTIAGLSRAEFSPSGDRIFFSGSAFATSGTVWSIRTDGSGARFVAGGELIGVVPSGRYRGDLLIAPHEYFVGGGSWDPLCLFSPEGRKLMLLETPPRGSRLEPPKVPVNAALGRRLLRLVNSRDLKSRPARPMMLRYRDGMNAPTRWIDEH